MPVKVKEIIRLIEQDGWFQVATRGGHRQLQHAAKPGRVTVPGKLSITLMWWTAPASGM